MRKNLPRLLFFLLISSSLIILSYFFVDRQMAWWLAAHHSRDFALLKILANNIVSVITGMIFLYYVYFCLKAPHHQIEKKWLMLCNSVVIAVFIKNVLKFVFARYWPTTFVCHNRSLISNHVYGFNWLQAGSAYQSFPSGHATLITTFALSAWWLFPRWRLLWALLALAVILGQIGMYYHFVSDIIGGITVGSLAAYYQINYWRRSAH